MGTEKARRLGQQSRLRKTNKKIEAAIKLLIAAGYKKPTKLKDRSRNLDLEIIYLIGLESVFVKKDKKFSPRKVQMRVAKSAALNSILDKHFKDNKRKAFDDKTEKTYNTEKTLVMDIGTKGLFKKFRLVERCYGQYFNTELFKTVMDPDYFPAGYDKKLRKGILAIGKGGVRAIAKRAAQQKSTSRS